MPKGPEDKHGDITPPLHLSVAYELPSIDEGAKIFEDPTRGYAYGRMGNPTVTACEEYLTKLEGAEGGRTWATNTGLSALQLLVMGLLAKGPKHPGWFGKVVTSPYIYGGSYHQFRMFHEDIAKCVVFVENPFDPASWEKLMNDHTRFVFLETPTNPTVDVFDIAAIAKIAHSYGAPLIVDNTLGVTLQRPLELGADAVLHSVTKSIIGTSSGLGGSITGTAKFVERYGEKITEYFIHLGLIMHPMSAWMALQNRASLPLQMGRCSKNALQIALFLNSREKVDIKVNYPFLTSNRQYDLVKRQMAAGGGLLSFELKDFDTAKAFVETQKSAVLAPHLGDVNNYLIIHPASTTHSKLSDKELAAVKITPGLVRLSVGLTDPKEVLEDFEEVLYKVHA